MLAKRSLVPVLILASFCIMLGTAIDARAVKEGQPLPHVKAEDMDGNPVDSKELLGKVILLDFWALTCADCMKELPHIIDLYNKYNVQGLEVIGMQMERLKIPVVKEALKEQNLTLPFPNVVDNRMRAMGQLGVIMLPTTILVDTEGIVQMFHRGYKPGFELEIEKKVKALLPPQ
jgi:peroxiredoxin